MTLCWPWLSLLPSLAASALPMHADYRPSADGRAIETESPSGRYFNRPLYGAGNGMLVLAGDRPIVKAAAAGHTIGTFMIALSRGGRCSGWAQLDETAVTTHAYRPGTSAWNVTSAMAPGLELYMTAAPTAGGLGMAVRVALARGDPEPGDELLWVFGAVGSPFDPSKSDPAVGSGDGPHRLISDRGNVAMLAEGFDPKGALGNKASLGEGVDRSFSLQDSNAVSVRGISSSATRPRAVSVAVDVVGRRGSDPSGTAWHNATALLADAFGPPPPVSPPPPPAVPKSLLSDGLVLRLRATDLVAAGVQPGGKVASWADSDGSVKLTQTQKAKQPQLQMIDFANSSSVPAVVFTGADSTSLTSTLPLGADQTFVAVVRTTTYQRAGGCCNALACTFIPTADPLAHPPSTKGVSVKRVGQSLRLLLDYDGQNDAGDSPIDSLDLILSTRYDSAQPGRSCARASGCDQVTMKNLPSETAQSTHTISLGSRESDPTHLADRYFDGAILELLVYNRSLSDAELHGVEAFVASQHNIMATSFDCETTPQVAEMVGSTIDLTQEKEVFFAFEQRPSATRIAETPDKTFEAAIHRTTTIEQRVQVSTPDPYFNAGIPMAAAAVDGLWRDDSQTFVHGAMAWDIPLVGWRSEYGGTVFGQSDRVAMEGARMVASQVQPDDPNRNGTLNINFTVCNADPTRLLTEESQQSRFYGVGRVMPPGSVGSQGMYDMQSQMFTQQIHMWRWTANATHEKLLRPGLALHAAWAEDCFDDDRNGLYHSYINTWPTDSVYYNGGESCEETAYMLDAFRALRDMAKRSGDAAAEELYSSKMERIRSNFFQHGVGLWINSTGHPAAWREEVRLRRLRPDAWSYSVFVPIDAGLLQGLEAVQALHYTEWGLERITNHSYPGERHWTSNWVPSIWSVREFWPGDNYALALAYFQTGLPDGGFRLLQGNMLHDMYKYMSPGCLGAHNGGTDFNDIVHPAARALVEGLFGIRPDLPNRVVEIAPQLSPDWDNASVTTPQVSIVVKGWRQQLQSEGTSSLSVVLNDAMPCPGCSLRLVIPLRAAMLTHVMLDGQLCHNYTVERGYGQALVVIHAEIPIHPMTSPIVASIAYEASHGYIRAAHIRQVAGSEFNLDLSAGVTTYSWSVESVDDPQRFLKSWTVIGGGVSVQLEQNRSGFGIISVNVRLGTSATGRSQSIQSRLFKLNISDPIAAAAHAARVDVSQAEATSAKWTTVDISPQLNGNLSEIFHPKGGYLSPRPATCSARIGIDGWSAWTFTYGQGSSPPVPQFFSNATGNITTPQGARFNVRATDPLNTAFVSQWDNYPRNVTVELLDAQVQANDVVWLLVSGSTNSMQTGLANAQIKFDYVDGTTDTLELIPPANYWSLTPIGGIDYDYARDGFCLPSVPPPTVQLGESNRAMVYSWRATAPMARVTLEALSLEVVVGLLAVSVSRPPTAASAAQPGSALHVASKTDDQIAIEPKPLVKGSASTGKRTGGRPASQSGEMPNSRTVQLWACGADPPVPPYGSGAIETSVFTHIQNITAVSVCGLSLASNGSLLGVTDVVQSARLYAGEMGLAVYPLIGGNLSSLHAAMARAEDFFAETVETAVELVADGFNLDLEIGTQDIQPKDTREYISFLNAWATALDTAGLELQYILRNVPVSFGKTAKRILNGYDLGGCDDPYKTDYMGLTCKQLEASKLHRLISMDTYAGPDACGATPCNLTKALGKDKAALCTAATGNCSRYMPGLMMGKPGALGNLSASELTATMDWLLDQGVTAISLWAGVPTEAWWSAMGHFLLRDQH